MSGSLSLQPAQFDLSIYKGDSVSVDFVLKNANGSAYDVLDANGGAGWSSHIESLDGTTLVKSSPTDLTVTLVKVGNPVTSSTLTFYVKPTTTAALNADTTYVYDIQYTWIVGSGGTAVTYNKTFIRGNITVTGDVT